MAEYVFTLRNVRKAHGDKVVLDNVTLSFLHGAKIGVVGPNGTGKSSLLRIMAGLDDGLLSGDIVLRSIDVRELVVLAIGLATLFLPRTFVAGLVVSRASGPGPGVARAGVPLEQLDARGPAAHLAEEGG